MPTPTPLLLYSLLPSFPNTTLIGPATHRAMIDQYSFGMRSICCSSTHLLLKLLLIYGSVFVSSSFRPPPSVHVNLPWGNLSPHVSCHAAVGCQARGSYIVPGATLLGAVLLWYTVNRLLQQTLLHKPIPFYGFVFVFLSSSLWPAGLPKAIRYFGHWLLQVLKTSTGQ